uniref:Uncharacterized protein n=1 Tax=Chlamydomonas leiostraca TaxID=1034604 RepID=A0A7S0RI98_9CHLO|mmetsp:Transcript_22792/g.57966  ORF Transcript_22792/g.57966 Transcript_22792/m.57966 type:complete len:262 (+) Transcript_22792:71-856(+)
MLAGKTVLVTGANRGLGLEVTKRVLGEGGRVVLACRDVRAGQQVVAEQLRQQQASCGVVGLDAAKPASVSQLIDWVKARKGDKIHGLVNNAAIYPDVWTPEVFSECVDTNVRGPCSLTTGLAPHMAEGGVVVMVSSGYGQRHYLSQEYLTAIESAQSLEQLLQGCQYVAGSAMGKQEVGMYKLSKAMLNRATQLLAKDPALTAARIAVNAVDPGWCRTRMGGPSATRPAEEGGESIFWALVHGSVPGVTGGFYAFGRPIEW